MQEFSLVTVANNPLTWLCSQSSYNYLKYTKNLIKTRVLVQELSHVTVANNLFGRGKEISQFKQIYMC